MTEGAIAVLDVFAKSTRATPDDVIRSCKRRLADFKTEAEEALVETKLRLGDAVRTLREKKHLSRPSAARQGDHH